MQKTTCKEVMTKNLITVQENEIVTTVAKNIEEFGFHHIPVLNSESKLVGIISQSDIERLKLSASIFKTKKQEEYNDALFESLMVKFVMTKNVTCLSPDDSIEKAYTIFKQNKFRALPILTNDTLVGIITPIDLLDHFFKN